MSKKKITHMVATADEVMYNRDLDGSSSTVARQEAYQPDEAAAGISSKETRNRYDPRIKRQFGEVRATGEADDVIYGHDLDRNRRGLRTTESPG